ncbi:PDR/VanB family oxidoreductase [Paraburkholderia silviterrae]|uniref:Oxidoreductase n=1 Tax=Paraburkholderia silviterrae TaxID=2528715 RepID=A0A4R5M672_9BURK|nr:PDR/VanB family oxidoreductase [Paraburkholderia silviterrae]TDG21033.1 oxidoreductase [Paraburkholderia silviterrae]
MHEQAGQRIAAVVTDAAMLTGNIKSIELAAADGAALPNAAPGAHIDLWLPGGHVRQYSVMECRGDGAAYKIAVLRDPHSRGGSSWIVDHLSKGQTIQLSGPRNHFALEEHGDEYILIAGGIGVTPIVPMAMQLASTGKKFSFHYLARAREQALLDVIESSALRDIVQFHFSDVQGEVDLRTLIGAPRARTHIYVCGPGRLIDSVVQAGYDWPADAIHFERFAVAPVNQGGQCGRDSFEVELARSQRVLTVPASQSILEVLRKERIEVDTVCARGLCGTCAVPLLAGEAEHLDAIQTEEEKAENKVIYVCISRARSARLVLDL